MLRAKLKSGEIIEAKGEAEEDVVYDEFKDALQYNTPLRLFKGIFINPHEIEYLEVRD